VEDFPVLNGAQQGFLRIDFVAGGHDLPYKAIR
jgi:hypothetical protein